MFITGLNRFFEKHGRKAFAAFTGIIIISFVLYFSPGFDITNFFGPTRPEREFLPPNIGEEEFRTALNSNLIIISLQLGGAPLNEQFVQQMAYSIAPNWARITKIAKQRGFRADDKAVFDKITEYQIFRGNDGFEKAAFDNFVKTRLTPFGFNSAHLEEAARGEIAQNRLSNAIRDSAISSDAEAKFEYAALNERINARLFAFKNEDFLDSVQLAEDELLAYFNANKNKYFTDAQSKAMVARFNHLDFEEKAETLVSDKEAEDYYAANKAEFTTNGATKPLDNELRKNIKNTLTKNKAAELAANKARDFSLAVYQIAMDSRAKSTKNIFIEEAKKSGAPLAETDWFNEKANLIKNVGAEPEFSSAVSELIMDQPLSIAISGRKAAFVALLLERQERRPAEFNEAKNEAEKDLRNSKAAAIASQKASESALTITEKLAKGATPEDIAEFKSPNAIVLPEFSLAKPPTESPYAAFIEELSLQTPPGRLSEIRNNADSSLFIFVETKKPPQQNTEEKLQQHREQYEIKKQNLAWFNFINSTGDRRKNNPPLR